MRTWQQTWVAAAVAVVALAIPAALAGNASAADKNVVDVPVSFTVLNINDSKVPCESDGAEYTVRGTIVAPKSALYGDGSKALTMYLHGLSYTGDTYYHNAAEENDFVGNLAEAGHASLIFDLPGYGSSDVVPNGKQLCYGSEAAIIHQMIGQLRGGDYTAEGKAVAFDKIGLGGASAAGFTAQAVAYSYDDLDALLLFGFADQGISLAAGMSAVDTNMTCFPGGEPRSAEEPETTGYSSFGKDDATFQNLNFHDADPAIVEAVTAIRPKDPCGRAGSAVPNLVTDNLLLNMVDVPVFLVYGEKDAIFEATPIGTRVQRHRFMGSDDVKDLFLPNTGNAIMLERSAAFMQAEVHKWLDARGF